MKEKTDIRKSNEPVITKKKTSYSPVIMNTEENRFRAENLRKYFIIKIAFGITVLIWIGITISFVFFWPGNNEECQNHTCDTDPCLCLSFLVIVWWIIFFYLVYSLAKYQKNIGKLKGSND